MNLPGDIVRLTLLEVELLNIEACIISKRFLNIFTEDYFISLYIEKNRRTEFNDLLKVLSTTFFDYIYKIVWGILQLNMENPKYINDWYSYLCLGIDGKDNNGETSLIKAASFGHTEVVRLLLLAGANPNYINMDDETALIYASVNGHIEIVKMLLAADASVHNKDFEGTTALIGASSMGDIEIVQLLLLAGANVHDKNNDGNTALDYALQEGNIEIVDLLRSYYNKN